MMRPPKAAASSGVRNIGILFAVVAALYLARELLIPLAFALTLSMILAPVVACLEKLHLGRVPSALVVVVVAMAAVGAGSWVIFNELVDVAIQLPAYTQNIHNKIEAMNAPGKGAFGQAAASMKALEKEIAAPPAPVSKSADTPAPSNAKARRVPPVPASPPLAVQVVAEPGNELEYVGGLIKPFLRPLAILGMVLIFTLYLLIAQHDLRNRLFRLVGLHQLNVMTQALNDATQRVGRYLMLQFLVNICFGVLCGTGLYLIGVPYAALWGAVAAILRLVPYVGSMIAAGLPLLLSLAVFDGWHYPLLVFVLFATLELATGSFVEPWLYGVHTGVSSLALLMTTVFWAALWGPAGLILSTPLTVCVVVLGRYVPQFSFLHTLLGDEATLVAEAEIYQRLLAMDDQEARVVAEHYLKDHTLTELYDSVLIPALTLAEHDRHKGALEAVREEFFFLSMKEMLVELPDVSVKVGLAEPVVESVVALVESVVEPQAAADPYAGTTGGRVFCLPASDEADEISAAMLSQLLELRGRVALSFPVAEDMLEGLELMEPSAEDVICISSLPPFAFARARTLSSQVRAHFPRTRLVVGVWGFASATERPLERFQSPRPDCLVTTLAQAVQAITVPADTPVESATSV